MKRNHPRGGSGDRPHRVGRAIQEVLAEVLRADVLRDPALRGVDVTILEVRASPDLRSAEVFVLPFGGSEAGSADELVAALDRAGAFLGGEVGRRAGLRFAPRLRFRMDETLEGAARIDRILDGPGDVGAG